MKTKFLYSLLFVTVFSHSTTLNVSFTGVLAVSPPECTINGATTTDINFGDIHETLIDGSYKKMLIDYELNCTKIYNNALKMTLNWNSITINGKDTVRTNRDNLGIAIYHNNTLITNGSIINFQYNSDNPLLYAVPVKPNGMTLQDGGNFTGTITMLIDYS
ncbi:fimbrial protein [Providencia huaxiensis]|uniref:Fimbrial protein n=2 Tax=Providencia huaxiensis TaxID=2027290 RepID=A0A8I2DAM6_9GAMM|nr:MULTISPECIES: fimbrial protein [Providencia]MBQ0268131.1 fimbrial protein [Providencia huaxiensis]MCD2529385.1 fimbrial protein [Providencia huaxiensis]